MQVLNIDLDILSVYPVPGVSINKNNRKKDKK